MRSSEGTPTDRWSAAGSESVNANFDRCVRELPDRPFLTAAGASYSYGTAAEVAARIAHGLAEIGVAPRDVVATMFENHADAVLVWLAVNRLGAVLAPLNAAYRGEFLRRQLEELGAGLVVCDASLLPPLIGIAAGTRLKVIVVRGSAPTTADHAFGLTSYDQLLGTERLWPDVALDAAGSLSLLINTAGTTGRSKACMVSHRYLCNQGRQITDVTGRTADETVWLPLPLFHMAPYSYLAQTLQLGGQIAIGTRFSVSGFWPEVERAGAKLAVLLGSMGTLVVRSPVVPSASFSGIRAVLGAPYPSVVRTAWQDRFRVEMVGFNGYGLTEACNLTTLPYGEPAPPDSCGRRNADFDVRIFDDRGLEVGVDEPGEIVFRPRRPGVMFDGYWCRPEALGALVRDLWFHTGDAGRFDSDGFLYFADRQKDYIRRRGENISASEVEEAFLLHPEIEEIAAFGVPSDLTEDDVKVSVVLHTGSNLTEDELCRWSVNKLPFFAVPRYVEFCDKLPKNSVGRVLKNELKAQPLGPATFDRETETPTT